MSMTTISAPERAEERDDLDVLLEALVARHGYLQVLEHLVQATGRINRLHNPALSERPSARYLMTLTPEEREPFLSAAVAEALPLYMADLAKTKAERELTADLETGEFYEYPEEDHA